MISSTKGNTGHLLGAAGAVEAIITIKAMQDSFVPPTINYKVPDEECDLDVVPNKGRNEKIKYAMSESLGFGGHNSVILLKNVSGDGANWHKSDQAIKAQLLKFMRRKVM